MQSEDGRILILQVVIDDTKLVCANIYAPNDPGAQHRFYLLLNNILQKFSSESIILGGDFNCPLSKEDKEGGRDFCHKYHVAEEIKSLMCSLDLEDVWRKLLPNKKQFTWRSSDQKNHCRLHYWLTSKQLLPQSLARKCEINFAPHCDHSSVYMEIEEKVRQPRGPGIWKFNSIPLFKKIVIIQPLWQKKFHSLLTNTKILKTKGSSGKWLKQKEGLLESPSLRRKQKKKKMQRPRKIPH